MEIDDYEIEKMDRGELIETVDELAQAVDKLETLLHTQIEKRKEMEKRIEELEKSSTSTNVLDEQLERLDNRIDRVHHERSKLARRVSALEEELGVPSSDIIALAEGGEETKHQSRLVRLVRHGPESVTDRPTAKMRRAKTLFERWEDWGSPQSDANTPDGIVIYRLATKEHDLLTRLQDTRNESLSWKQVYRAMELIADWSDGAIKLKKTSAGKELRYKLEKEKL